MLRLGIAQFQTHQVAALFLVGPAVRVGRVQAVQTTGFGHLLPFELALLGFPIQKLRLAGAAPLRGQLQNLDLFFVITLPIIMPAIASGFLLAMTLSLDDLVIASFLSGPGSTTLPMVIFSKIRLGLNPTINALATIFVLIIGLLVISANYIMLRSQRRRDKEIAAAMRNGS